MNSIFLDNIKEDMDSKTITESQGMYLIYKNYKLDYFLSHKEVTKLINSGYILGNAVTAKITAFRKDSDDLTGSIKPAHGSELSNEVTKKLCRLLCVSDNKGNLSMPGGASPEELIKYTADKYLKKEQLVAYYYLLLLFIFPVAGSTNKRWEKHFTMKKYEGPRLRLRALAHGKLFLKIAKTRDMGVFMYGAYLYMKSATAGEKPYITTITKFLYDYDDWYFDAEEKIDEAASIEDLFKNKAVNNDFNMLTADE